MEKERYNKDDLYLISLGNLIKGVEKDEDKVKLIQKLCEEYKELITKLDKLKAFLSDKDTFNKIDFIQCCLLEKQKVYMEGYAEILFKRIELLGKTN